MSTVEIISIVYLEPDWAQTRAAVEATGLRAHWIDRKGVGSLAAAINRGAALALGGSAPPDYLWVVTNVRFTPDVPAKLQAALDAHPTLAAVHPEFPSDHAFCRPWGVADLDVGVPFLEFTAPMVRAEAFRRFALDTAMPYWGHDLDWGWRVRKAGWQLAVAHDCAVEHTYIRHSRPLPITAQRRQARRASDRATTVALQQKYGPQWREVLEYKG